jgi:DNA-binding IclR family transcriptional regulator
MPVMSTNVTILEAVFSALGLEPRSRTEILAEVTREAGVSPNSVSAMLSELVADGVLVRPSRGVYAVHPAILAAVADHE